MTTYMYKLFPPSVRLVSDIPAGDGNIEKLFYSIVKLYLNACVSLQLSSSSKCVYFAYTTGMCTLKNNLSTKTFLVFRQTKFHTHFLGPAALCLENFLPLLQLFPLDKLFKSNLGFWSLPPPLSPTFSSIRV